MLPRTAKQQHQSWADASRVVWACAAVGSRGRSVVVCSPRAPAGRCRGRRPTARLTPRPAPPRSVPRTGEARVRAWSCRLARAAWGGRSASGTCGAAWWSRRWTSTSSGGSRASGRCCCSWSWPGDSRSARWSRRHAAVGHRDPAGARPSPRPLDPRGLAPWPARAGAPRNGARARAGREGPPRRVASAGCSITSASPSRISRHPSASTAPS